MNYSDLVTYISDYAARSDTATVNNVPLFIEFSTAMFNHGMGEQFSPLRVREMLATTSLTPNGDGEVTLPSDYLSFRAVTSDASIARNLTGITPDFSTQNYAGSGAGLSNNFTLVGNVLRGYPQSSSDVTLLYYQKIPDINDTNTSNWLLAKQPTAYLHAGLLQLAIYTKDDNLFSRSAALVQSIMDGLRAEDVLAQYARGGATMGMITP